MSETVPQSGISDKRVLAVVAKVLRIAPVLLVPRDLRGKAIRIDAKRTMEPMERRFDTM